MTIVVTCSTCGTPYEVEKDLIFNGTWRLAARGATCHGDGSSRLSRRRMPTTARRRPRDDTLGRRRMAAWPEPGSRTGGVIERVGVRPVVRRPREIRGS